MGVWARVWEARSRERRRERRRERGVKAIVVVVVVVRVKRVVGGFIYVDEMWGLGLCWNELAVGSDLN